MVVLACPDTHEGLWEAELFGIEKDVASGVRSRIGKLEEADGTTLFLDEIADLPRRFQPKLFRAVQFKEFNTVGGRKVRSNFRLICATCRDLSPPANGEKPFFREELFYRLNTFAISLLPLSGTSTNWISCGARRRL